MKLAQDVDSARDSFNSHTEFSSRLDFFNSPRGIIFPPNGSCYKAKTFAAACKDLKLKHIRTKPYTPKTNGKAERFIQTALREWAYARACQTSEQRKIHLPEWTHMYNWPRPHGSLNCKPPISRIAHAMNKLLRSGVWRIAQGTPNKSEDFQMATPRPNAPLFRARVRPGDCGIRFGRRLAAAQGRPLLQDMSHRGRS